ncbi:hypothetical protein [Hyphobacterium sp.]|uniref:hypothetical protein n=1 Tax=Hyphobacterium sp. TaxID=2004662 RepID=UPI003BA9D330
MVQVIGVSNARALLNPTVIAFSLFAVYLVGYVVNIGTGLRLGASPRIVAVVGLALAGMMGWAMDGILTSDVLWRAIRWFMIYVYGHLGVSFVLAAAFATPGCEMRSIPILIGRLTGKPPRDHHCPGPIDAIDRWEAEQSEIG